MGINQFKTYALQTLCEAHLWKTGERSVFELLGVQYLVVKWEKCWSLATRNRATDMWNAPQEFPDAGRLFNHIFQMRCISYN